MKVIDLFCGAGGFSYGFQEAGFDVILGVDNDSQALDTYQLNHPDTEVIESDIRDVNDLPKCDIVISGPPCPNFSNANRKKNPEKGMELVNEFLRLKDEINPKYWIMENVPQITKYLDRETFPTIKTLNAVEYGVPQRRKRCFSGKYSVPKATHSDSDEKQVTLDDRELEPHLTVLDAIWDLLLLKPITDDKKKSLKLNDKQKRRIEEFKNNFPDDLLKPSRTIKTDVHGCKTNDTMYIRVPDHSPEELSKKAKEYLERRNMQSLKKHRPRELNEPSRTIPANMYKGVPYGLVRMPNHECFDNVNFDWDSDQFNREIMLEEPSVVINTKMRCSHFIDVNKFLEKLEIKEGANGIRRLTVRECARIQSFPDSFIFKGSKSSKYRQIGNAVPPLLAYRLAKALKRD